MAKQLWLNRLITVTKSGLRSKTVAELVLPPVWGVERRSQPVNLSSRLGDGYEQTVVLPDPAPVWSVAAFFTDQQTLEDTLAQLELYQGASVFQWSPGAGIAIADYVCEGWRHSQVSPNLWRIEATLTEASPKTF